MPAVKMRSPERLLGRLGDPAGEHHRDGLGAPDVHVVLYQGLEEATGPPRIVEDEGAGDLGLAHREFPPVVGRPVGCVERGRDDRDPAVEEPLEIVRTEGVADGLEARRVLTGREPVGQGAIREPLVVGLALRPFMAVQPDFGRVGWYAPQSTHSRHGTNT